MSQPPDPEQNREPSTLDRPRGLDHPRAVMRAGDFARALPMFQFFFQRLANSQLVSAAAALSYSSTLAVVPALALLLESLAVFPVFNDIRAKIESSVIDNLVPDTGLEFSQALGTFVDAAGKLTAAGIIGLLTTAVLLLLNIEGQLNAIVGVTRPRPLVLRIVALSAVLTLGPLLLGIGLSLFAAVAGMHILPDTSLGNALTVLLGHVAPTLITWALLTFVYDVVPHDRVHWKDAAIGAGYAALVLAALRYTFAFYIGLMTSYQAIYGALAAVPVFLVWIYFVWLVVMGGAVIAAAMPDWRKETGA